MKEILELIDANKSDDAYEKSLQLTTKRACTDEIFKIGVKALYKLIDKKVTLHVNLFNLWYKYCIKAEQNLLDKNRIVHYAVVFAKNLLSKQQFDNAYLIWDQICTFYDESKTDVIQIDGQKLIKFCSSLCANHAASLLTNKTILDTINETIHHSFKLAEYSFKFSLKIKSNGTQFGIENFQNYHVHYVKFIETLGDGKHKEAKLKLNQFHRNLILTLDNSRTNASIKSMNRLNEYTLLLMLNMFNLIYTNGLNDAKSNINEMFNVKFKIPSNEVTKKIPCASKTIKSKSLFDQLVSLLHKIIEYSCLLKAPFKATTLRSIAKFELQLSKDLFAINLTCLQATPNLIMIFALIIELLFNYNKSFLTESAVYSKFLQESFLSLFGVATSLHVKLIQTYYDLQLNSSNKENVSDSDGEERDQLSGNENEVDTQNDDEQVIKSMRSTFYKPLGEFYSIEKIFEYHFKVVNSSKDAKHSKLNMDLCERLLASHLNYIDWLRTINVFHADELWKFYHNLENCCMKISAQFFAESLLGESLIYQQITFKVTQKKLKELKFTTNVDVNTKTDLKNLIYVAENLLLSYRHRDKYVEASQSLLELYRLLKEIKLDTKHVEMIVLNWCKLKRDLAKASRIDLEKDESLKKLKYTSITDYYKLDADITFTYLFEELRCLKNISLNDAQLQLDDEIFVVLESLENKLQDDEVLILGEKCRKQLGRLDGGVDDDFSSDEADELVVVEKCRWYLEVAQFKLSKNTYTPSAHTRSQIPQLAILDCLENSEKLIKVFNSAKPKTKLSLKIINFQTSIFRLLIAYSASRDKMSASMRALNKTRQKNKHNTQSNVDNLQLIASNQSTQYLICNEFDQEQAKNDTIRQLEECYAKLEEIKDYKLLSDESFVSLRKQFYGYLDLLAHLNGFFCMPMRKMHILKIKFRLMRDEFKSIEAQSHIDNSKSSDTSFDATQFVLSTLNLMKSYLNLHLFKQYDEINEFLSGDESNIKKPSKNVETLASELTLNTIEKNKLFQNKSDCIVHYYLLQAHYFILRQYYSTAIKIIKIKVITSPVLTGRQTCAHYETKYYLRYLQFLLSTISISQSDVQKLLHSINSEETPLSILEECYQAIFSVARFHVQNCIEPNRVFSSSSSGDEELKFFNIGSAECYRVLSENLDAMQLLCKYYVELSRYREATCFIREGMDLSQLHFCKRRLTHYLLHQINADLIASSLSDATLRLDLAEKFITEKDSTTLDDILHMKNFIHLYQLKIFNFMKSGNIKDCLELMDNKIVHIKESKASIQASPSVVKTTENGAMFNELIVEIHLHLCNAVKALENRRESKAKSLELSNTLRQMLIDSKTITIFFEKWYLSEYYCLLYESEAFTARNKISHLQLAYDLMRLNPQPFLYRRVCVHMFHHLNAKHEKLKEIDDAELNFKIGFLLETQAIALRHKACAIQIKNKKKLLIDAKLHDQILKLLGFNSFTLDSYYNEYVPNNLPKDWCVLSFVLLENMDLYLIRLEQNDNMLIRLKYDQKFIDTFKEIINDNDLSMKESEKTRFWSFRTSINNRLAQFLSDLEEEVFSIAKLYLVSSFLTKHQSFIQSEINIFIQNTRLKNPTRAQRDIIYLLFNYNNFNNEKLMREALQHAKFSDDSIETYLSYFKSNAVRLNSELSTFKRKHNVLLVDKNLHQIPWECLPCLKSQQITRMPSIHFLLCHIKTSSYTIDKLKGYYIVDPGGDLAHTKAKFKEFMDARQSWTGTVGVAPSEEQYKKALVDHELFIYTGHGSGGQYYPSEDVQKLRVKACAILMGCSSGNQYVMGDFEPYGTILAYIMAGCPCVVGNLWDVTDRDIDKFTEEFLNTWLESSIKENREIDDNICVYLNKARGVCKMSHLNGSAPVAYGLPVYFK